MELNFEGYGHLASYHVCLFFNFLLMAEKNLFTVWGKYLMLLNDLIKFFQKIVWLIGFGYSS